jgi:diguanylate cyclase (GGDEF)-like protein/PAS domain S-box-containing protein
LSSDGHESDLQRRNQAMERLVLAVQELSLAEDLEGVMRVVRRAARELTGADGATFVLRDGDKCFYAEENAIAPLWKGQRFPMKACVSGWVMLNQESAIIEDIYSDPRIPVDAYRPTFVKSLAMVPIRKEAPLGAIGNYWARRHRATSKETELLEALANTTAVALERIDEIARRKEAERKYRRIFEDAVVGIFQSTPEGQYVHANRALAEMYGYSSPEQLMAEMKDISHQLLVEPTDYEELMRRLKEHGAVRNFETQIHCKDGTQRWILANVQAIRDSTGKVLRKEGTIQDVTDRKAAESRVRFLAYYDALTELPNRTLLQDRLTKAMASARRHGEKVAVLFLDVDRFKTINDSLGHSVGDLLLKALADRLAETAREQDTVARLGGDEFVVVLTGVKDTADVVIAADRLLKAVCREFSIRQHVLSITCSIGISLSPEHGDDPEALLKNADAAMYSAKERMNSFQFFTLEMNDRAIERLTLENGLRSALEKKELFLAYQPLVDLSTQRIAGAEALLRWQHPTLGVVPPMKFIPIAENSGLIIPIGEWVLRTACTQAREWQKQGLHDFSVAVNVSAVQFRQENFLQLVRRILEDTGLPVHCLELELTESLLISNAELTVQTLKELKSMGIKLSIDDFGTGYSSLSYLRQFPLNKLKIDRSFVNALSTDSRDTALTATIINMAKALNLTVIAEGVETPDQIRFLQSHSCEEAQGYYFGKPVSAAEFTVMLRSKDFSSFRAASH